MLKLIENTELNGLEIHFVEYNATLKDTLKSEYQHHFKRYDSKTGKPKFPALRYSKFNKCWYVKNPPAAVIDFMSKFVHKHAN